MKLTRIFGWVLISVFLVASSVQAQLEAPPAFPTVSSLQTTVIPPLDRVEIAQRLLAVDKIPAPPSAAPTRQVGDQESFWVTDSTGNRAFQVEATLRSVGEHIYIWVENGTPINQEALQSLTDAFDEAIYQPVRDLWGSEALPGIDGDPRVYALFAHGMGASVAGYFMSEHTYPVEAVPNSNEHEMFFFNLDVIGNHIDDPEIETTLAHEFQHMIRANLQINEDTWINEGFSQFTEFYLGYGSPFGAILSYLSTPETQLNSWNEDGSRIANYGMSVLFITYFYERFGLEGIRLLSADSSSRGMDAVDSTLRNLGEPGVDEFFADFVLANWVNDPTLEDGHYGHSWLNVGQPSPLPLATVTQYPYRIEGAANQYSGNYFVFTNLDGIDTLNIRLDAPSTVSLVPTDTASGQHVWYSNRADYSDTTLTRSFDLSAVNSATLNYQTWYHTEEFWDYAYVMVSPDQGETWDILSTPNMTQENPHHKAYGTGYSGKSQGWLDQSISLDQYAGEQILVRFEVITDDAITQPGMLIDDVSIPEIDYASDFESGGDGWQADGWLWMDNILPQQTWVQAVERSGNQVDITRWRANGQGEWSLPLIEDVDQVALVISPFAPVTTVAMPYTLTVEAD